MNRRTILSGIAATLTGACTARAAPKAAASPFPCVAVPGDQALATWTRLKAEGNGWPVVVGDDDDLARVLEAVGFDKRSPAEILAAADRLAYPQAIEKFASEQWGDDPVDVEVGEWPVELPPSTGLSIATDLLTGGFKPKINILLLPARDGAEAFAHLKWGGWNACPPPEHHVTAIRAWTKRYGAELVGLSGDVANIRVAKRPRARNEALGLAREQLSYCEDIVLQGTGDLATLAGQLMADDWWFFWWD